MSRAQDAWRHLARVTVEFTTPFRVGSGEGSVHADLTPVVDVNGLPALPGASLAGVLRHADPGGDAAGLYGRGGDEAVGSRLWVTWGHVHGADDRPVEGVLVDGPGPDPVLADALSPTVRDHVRIGHRGAPERTGKFEEAVVSAGHRFTFDLAVEGGAEARSDLDRLLGLLASGRIRVGGSTRRGLGAFRVVRARVASCRLNHPDGVRRYLAWPVRLDAPLPAGAEPWHPPARSDGRVLELRIEPDAYWAVHGSDPWTLQGEDKAPDLNPVRDGRVVWGDGRGRLDPDRFYLPGSSIKGAVAHRVAFHANLLAGRFADRVAADGLDGCVGGRNPEVRYLFGAAKDDGSGDQAGRVFIDDVWLDDGAAARLQRVPHIAVDRFTGGVLDGFLMDERVFYRTGPLAITIRFADLPPSDDESVRPRALEALRRALRDLIDGGLPLGAGASRGNGVFRAADGYDFDAAWGAVFPDGPEGGPS